MHRPSAALADAAAAARAAAARVTRHAPRDASLSERSTPAAPLEHGARVVDAVAAATAAAAAPRGFSLAGDAAAASRPATRGGRGFSLAGDTAPSRPATRGLSLAGEPAGSTTARPHTSASSAAAAFAAAPSPPRHHVALALAPPPSTARGVAAATAAPTPIRLSRRDGWTRFLAYEGCWQAALAAAADREPHAAPFLADGCALLKAAFGFDGLLLAPVPADGVDGAGGAAGAVLAWDDAEGPGALPTIGFKPEVERRSVVKVFAGRLACADLRGGDRGRTRGSPLRGGSSALAPPPPSLIVAMRPAAWARSDAASAGVDADGRAPGGDVLELGPADLEDDLVVEVARVEGRGDASSAVVVARGVVPVADVRQAAGSCAGDFACGADVPPDGGSAGDAADAEGRHGLLALLARGGAAAAAAAAAAAGAAADADAAVVGKRWVTLYDDRGVRYGHIKLGAFISTAETTVIREATIRNAPPGAANAGAARPSLTVTAWDVYDAVFAAALTAQKCGPRRLSVTGHWAWLLRAFAASYGVRPTYTSLAHAAWIVRPANATATAYCLTTLKSLLAPLVEAGDTLPPAERALLASVETGATALVAATLEAYHCLSEDAPTGVTDGGAAAPVVPPPALQPAVELCGLLCAARAAPADAAWLAARFAAAAVRRYAALETACEAAAPPYHTAAAAAAAAGDGGAAAAYGRLEALATALRAELGADLTIHDAAVLPSCINLPQLAAAEYGRLFADRLAAVLTAHPPPEPTQPAVDLLVTVGQQQEFLAYHNLLPPPGHPGALDALAVFGPHVRAWIEGSRQALVARCRALEATTVATAATSRGGATPPPPGGVAPLVDELLALAGAEVGRYERVVRYWPEFGADVEGAACAALRAATAAVSRQCGLAQVPAGGDALPTHPGSARVAPGGRRTVAGGDGARAGVHWKWSAPPPAWSAAALTIAPHEAVLLNSLRRLLVVAPQTERLLAAWVSGDDESASDVEDDAADTDASPRPRRSPSPARVAALTGTRDAPALGAQLAQLVKELRCEYAGAVTAAASRLSAAVFRLPGRSLRRVLEERGVEGTPADAASGVRPSLEAMEEVVLGLARSLDARAVAALGRGLWDHAAAQICAYVELLHEGADMGAAAPARAWRGRNAAAACLDAVDKFFAAALAGVLGHALAPRDLDPPATAARTAALLADNTVAATAAYTVY